MEADVTDGYLVLKDNFVDRITGRPGNKAFKTAAVRLL